MKVAITQYIWEGKWGLFKIKTHCGECDITTAQIKSLLGKELKGKGITLTIKPWLDNWWRVILKGAYHAPIVLVNGKLFWQYHEKNPLMNRDKLKTYLTKLLQV